MAYFPALNVTKLAETACAFPQRIRSQASQEIN
jgi:hypothetical protein